MIKGYDFVVLRPMKKIIVIAAMLLLAGTGKSWAWGKRGHGLVAEVAFSLLDSATKERVHRYFADLTIEQAANWMDDVRSDHHYDYMKQWHYLDVDKGQTYQPTNEPNVLNELDLAIKQLQNRDKMSEDDIRKDILVIMHLVGDMHQPLHVGYGNDKGGNNVQVRYKDHGSNLHRVWDTEMIEDQRISLAECLKKVKDMDKEEYAMFANTNTTNWMRQPRAQLDAVYDFKDGIIDDAYVQKNKARVEEEIAIAGIRLATILKSLFGS